MIFIKSISLKDGNYNVNEYPYNIPVLKNFKSLKVKAPVTFFVGENGSGKSTLIEAIAVACGINAEGGSQNFCFETQSTHSSLHESLIIARGADRPVTKYFLRAESFYNVASEIDRQVKENHNLDVLASHGGKSLHQCSHGESFITLIQNRFYDRGLYILDEPEAALSPSKQMSLLVLIDDLVKKGSQFIISTHSPIILAYPNSVIYDFNNNLKETKYEDTEHYKLYKMFIDNPEMVLTKLFKETD
jgi:predicted ATPase